MSAISNTLVLGSIDHITAVLKAQQAAVSKTENLYDKILREQNPDDIVNDSGASVAYNSDAASLAGSRLFEQYAAYTEFLSRRSVGAGYTSLAALLLARGLRVPSSYNTIVQGPGNGGVYIDPSLVFSDTEISMATMTHGGTYAAGTALSVLAELAYAVVEVTCAEMGAADWVLDIDVTYSDDTVATEEVTVSSAGVLGSQYPIGQLGVTSASLAGQTLALLSDTSGMVAGQKVLLRDPLYSTALSANASSAQAIVYVAVTQAGAFRAGDAVTVRDGSANENLTILSVDYDLGNITFTTALSNSYTTAAKAFMYLQAVTGNVLRPGWQEMREIATVVANTSLAFTANLQHSYYTGATVTRLIKSIEDVVTSSGGTAGDAVAVVTVVERTPTQ